MDAEVWIARLEALCDVFCPGWLDQLTCYAQRVEARPDTRYIAPVQHADIHMTLALTASALLDPYPPPCCMQASTT